MNRAALNVIAINGNLYIRLPAATAGVAVQSSLPITYGIGLAGTAAIAFQSENELYKQSRATASSSVVVDAEIEAYRIASSMGEGLAPIAVDSWIEPFKRITPEIEATIRFDAEMDGQSGRIADGEGIAEVVFDSGIETRVVPPESVEGVASIIINSGLPAQLHFRPDLEAGIAVRSTFDSYSVSSTFGEGEASVVFQSTYEATVHPHPPRRSGHAQIVFGSTLPPSLNVRPTGTAAAEVQSDLEGYTVGATFGEGSSAIVFDAEYETTVWPHPPRRSGHAYVRVEGRLAPHVAKSGMVESTAEIHTSGRMNANLRITEGGQAVVEVAGSGRARIGDRHQLSGKGAIELYARGRSDRWRHVHGQGQTAIIELRLTAERYGIPAIPTEYVPARADWHFTVPRDDWHFVVPQDNWGRQ